MSVESSSRASTSHLSRHSVQAEWLTRLEALGVRYAGVRETSNRSRSWGLALNGWHVDGITIDDKRDAIIGALLSDEPVSFLIWFDISTRA